jgi:hypothetical protein
MFQSQRPLPSTNILPTVAAIATQSTSQESKPTRTSLVKYKILVDVMLAFYAENNGNNKVDLSTLAPAIRKRNRNAFSGKFKAWLKGAADAGIINLHDKTNKKDEISVTLCPSVLLSRYS